MVLLYMVTFTIHIPQMLAYIPYMDPMGYNQYNKLYTSKEPLISGPAPEIDMAALIQGGAVPKIWGKHQGNIEISRYFNETYSWLVVSLV